MDGMNGADDSMQAGPPRSGERRDFASELKFALDADRVSAIRAWARTHLEADPNGTGPDRDTYHITSLYYDTAGFDVFHGTGSFGRSKYRVRRYNGDDVVFLERKTKRRSWVSKRRSPVGIDTLSRLEEPEADALWPGFWFHRRLLGRRLQPACQVHYLRTARVGLAEGQRVRLTLDCGIRALPAAGPSCNEADAVPLLDGTWILELKFQDTLPALFKRMIAELAPVEQRLSKYKLAVRTLGLATSANPARSAPVRGSGTADA